VLDFSPLAQLPLEKCYLSATDHRPGGSARQAVKELVALGLRGRAQLRGARGDQDARTPLLPEEYRNLPDEDYAAIGSLRDHPKLRQLGRNTWPDGLRGHRIEGSLLAGWDREQTFFAAVRKSGFEFWLQKLPTGTYSLSILNQPISDLSILVGAPISVLRLGSGKVTDLSPIRDLPLRVLGVWNNPQLEDLGPLRGMHLEDLSLESTKVSDLSPLARMPLIKLYLHGCKNLTDVSPLAEIATLERLTVPKKDLNFEVLRKLPKLKWLAFGRDAKNAEFPDSTAQEFLEGQCRQWLAPPVGRGGFRQKPGRHHVGHATRRLADMVRQERRPRHHRPTKRSTGRRTSGGPMTLSA
jgi:hypothetical protein